MTARLFPNTVAVLAQPSQGSVTANGDGTLTYAHTGTVSGNDSFTYTVNDDDGETSNAATVNLSIEESSGLTFSSDDFNSASLNSDWVVVNPQGDGLLALTGTGTADAYLELSVPAGEHDLWRSQKDAVRVMQASTDSDFEIEAKFASEPSAKYQLQGILIEEDDSNWLRFDTYHDGSNLRVFAAATTNGSSQVKINVAVASGAASYLRVNRQGDEWRLEHSADGTSWTEAGSFTQGLAVDAVGTFAGNAGNSPAFTSQVDYFFNTAAPIISRRWRSRRREDSSV